ncbi:MAG TPA: PHB depolymerase family esterase [Deltaproteobacteria bacterium]|nr:PHB depolymerase family esterase [Deltaproteobacteria bacterium]HQI80443.1 PHB depolymerase family esterase [Deltaproteobacteria bacterium]
MRRLALIVAGFLCTAMATGLTCRADDAQLTGRTATESITSGTMERTYLTYTPANLPESAALLIVLHGSLGTGQKVREQSGGQFDRLADRVKCMVVYPDGHDKHWNDCRTVPKDKAHELNMDDVGFITALIDTCREKNHISPDRVYLAGLSNGGHMCFRLASEMPDKIRGIAAMGACMPVPSQSKCPAARTGVKVMIVNGTEDPINPFEGGTVRLLWVFSKGEVMSSLESARSWLRAEDRVRRPDMVMLPDTDPGDGCTVERLEWGSSGVRHYIVHGGGHTIPGGTQYLPLFIVGRTCRDFEIAQEMWAFFEAPSR